VIIRGMGRGVRVRVTKVWDWGVRAGARGPWVVWAVRVEKFSVWGDNVKGVEHNGVAREVGSYVWFARRAGVVGETENGAFCGISSVKIEVGMGARGI
jgi:hypothetical protein